MFNLSTTSNCCADPELLDLLISGIEKLKGTVPSDDSPTEATKTKPRRGPKKPTNAGLEGKEVDCPNMNLVLNVLLRAVSRKNLYTRTQNLKFPV